MNKYQAIFIVGSPGSGKDVIIRDISSNYPIVEFTSNQLSEMLSEDSKFKKSKPDKQNALLYGESILVNCKSYDLDFLITKNVLESIGYTPHLIYVQANMKTSFERVKNRNLKESLEKISQGNSNKSSILEAFDTINVVDNSEILLLDECRKFVSDKLEDLKFESKLTLDDIVPKKRLKSRIVPQDKISSDLGTLNFIQTFGETFGESLDEPSIESSPLSPNALTNPQTIEKPSNVLKKIKHGLFKSTIISPKGI